MSKSTMQQDVHWLEEATQYARLAIDDGEVPIAAIVVAGGRELARAHTEVRRVGSIVAHGEIAAIRQVGNAVWTAARPLVVYTNLEPCLMCCGAALQAGFDEIVYAMEAKPDGGAHAAQILHAAGELPVIVRQAGDREQSHRQFAEYLQRCPEAPGATYARSLLDGGGL